MSKRTLIPVAAVASVALGAVALAFTRASRATEPCGCLDPATCGDREVVCPAGPDCFAPDVCIDHDVVCPAD